MQILIAEDEVEIAKALKVMLERSKYSVDIVHNGIDATSTVNYAIDDAFPGTESFDTLMENEEYKAQYHE